MNRGSKNRIFGFDVMRSIAILCVLFAHTCYILPLPEYLKHFFVLALGFIGVEFFFILSGFLIGKILLELAAKQPFNSATIKYFWIRRWFRTLPAYYLALLLSAAQVYYFSHEFVFSEPYQLLYFIFSQNIFSSVTEFFKHSWSLSIEEWFYLLLPLWILLFFRIMKGKNLFLYAIIAGIIASILLRMLIVYLYNPSWNLQVRMMVPLRLDSLMIGVLLAWIYIHYRAQWEKYAVPYFIAGLVAITLCISWLDYDVIRAEKAGYFSKTIYFTVFSAASALCMPYLSMLRTAKYRLAGFAFKQISLISYSLYLFHKLAIFAFRAVCYKWSLPHRNPTFLFTGIWITIFVFAAVIYRFYERPFTALRERFRLKNSRRQVPSPSD